MIDIDSYDQSIIVSSDGDFYSLVKYLYKKNKLKCVISHYKETCSSLLKKSAREKIIYIDDLYIRKWDIKRYNNEKAPQEDGTSRGAFSYIF